MILDLIDGILRTLNLPFYHGPPEFAQNSVPPVFIYYNVYDTSALSGDGQECSAKYYVTINIFGNSKALTQSTYSDILGLFLDNGFVRAGGNYSTNNNFPKYLGKSVDFSYIYEI